MSKEKLEIVVQGTSGVQPIDVRKYIYLYKGEQVMFDADLARLYGVEVRVLKQAVRRNIDRFPSDFMYVVPMKEANELLIHAESQIVMPVSNRFGGADPFAFTEQGVAMLSSVLRSETAVKINIEIIRAFVSLRRMMMENKLQEMQIEELRMRMSQLEMQIENNLEAVNDLSEDVREDIDRIYEAIGELSLRQNSLDEKKKQPIKRIGFDVQ